MPFDTSRLSRAGTNTPVSTTAPTVNPPSSEEEYNWYDPRGWDPRTVAANVVRGAGGFAPGGPVGAGVNALTELGAQTIEDKPYNWPSVGGAAAMGYIPFPIVGKGVKAAIGAAGKGGLLSGGGTALRQQTEEGLHVPSVEEGQEILLSGALGGVGGVAASKIASKFDTSKFKKFDTTKAGNVTIKTNAPQAEVDAAIAKAVDAVEESPKSVGSGSTPKAKANEVPKVEEVIDHGDEGFEIIYRGGNLKGKETHSFWTTDRQEALGYASLANRPEDRVLHTAKIPKGKYPAGNKTTGGNIPEKWADIQRAIPNEEVGNVPLASPSIRVPQQVSKGEPGYEDWIKFRDAQREISASTETTPSKASDTSKIQLPAELKGSRPTYSFGSRKFEPQFDNDVDKALYIIARPIKSKADHKFIKFLQEHLGMEEKELRAAGIEVRDKLKIYLSGQPNDGEVKIPQLFRANASTSPVKGKVDIVTGRPVDATVPSAEELAARTLASKQKAREAAELLGVRLPDNPDPVVPKVETPPTVDPTVPKVDLQTASPTITPPGGVPPVKPPEVKLGDFETKGPNPPRTWKTHPIRKLAAEARQLQTGLDLSFPFRQGITNVTRKEFWQSMKPMMQSALKEGNFEKFQKEISDDPLFELMEKAGLEFSELGKNAGKVEEAISKDTFVEKLGIAGIKPIRMSNRAYMAFGNKLRKDLFKSMSNDMEKLGISLLDADGKVNENARAIARYINDATGRGHMGNLEKNAEILNDVIFSPKLIASRVNMFRRAFQDPRMLEKGVDSALAKSLRKRAIRDMMAVGGLAGSAIGISEWSGAKGTLDPTSTDFGKLKIGNTRLDLTGGFQQYVRVAAQLATGKTNALEGDSKDINRKNVAERFARNKLSPLAGLVVDWMAEKNVLGENFTWTGAAKDRIIPLIAQDIQEVFEEDPRMLPLTTIPGMFGVGVQSYGEKTASGGKGNFKPSAGRYKMPSIKLP